MTFLHLFQTPVLLLVGVLAGFLNSMGGGGATVTLPILLGLGLEPHVALACNRFALAWAGVPRLVVFSRSGLLPWSRVLRWCVPVGLGALLGGLAVTVVSRAFVADAIYVAIPVALVLLLHQGSALQGGQASGRILPNLVLVVIGGWTGLIGLESPTFFLLAFACLFGLELRSANATKSVMMMLCNVASTAVFLGLGTMDWPTALALTLGNLVGSWGGARMATRKEALPWIRRLLIAGLALEGVTILAGLG